MLAHSRRPATATALPQRRPLAAVGAQRGVRSPPTCSFYVGHAEFSALNSKLDNLSTEVQTAKASMEANFKVAQAQAEAAKASVDAGFKVAQAQAEAAKASVDAGLKEVKSEFKFLRLQACLVAVVGLCCVALQIPQTTMAAFGAVIGVITSLATIMGP